MWIGAIAWQIGYDTVYAYVDVKDDTRLGLKSTAILFGQHGKTCIGLFYGLTVLAWSIGLAGGHVDALRRWNAGNRRASCLADLAAGPYPTGGEFPVVPIEYSNRGTSSLRGIVRSMVSVPAKPMSAHVQWHL